MPPSTPSALSTPRSAVPGGAAASAERRDTKERLLDAAERLFARRGFVGTSMRALTRAARTSVSAANYHFGSKDALLRAALERRVEPINRRRLERLDALEIRCRTEGRGPQVEEVLEAFLRPAFEMTAASAETRLAIRQIAARLFADPPELVAPLKREIFSQVIERFLHALQVALPERDGADLERLFQFTIGVMVHVLAGHLDNTSTRQANPPAEAIATGDEVVLASMIAFAAAGLRTRNDGIRAHCGDPT